MVTVLVDFNDLIGGNALLASSDSLRTGDVVTARDADGIQMRAVVTEVDESRDLATLKPLEAAAPSGSIEPRSAGTVEVAGKIWFADVGEGECVTTCLQETAMRKMAVYCPTHSASEDEPLAWVANVRYGSPYRFSYSRKA